MVWLFCFKRASTGFSVLVNEADAEAEEAEVDHGSLLREEATEDQTEENDEINNK